MAVVESSYAFTVLPTTTNRPIDSCVCAYACMYLFVPLSTTATVGFVRRSGGDDAHTTRPPITLFRFLAFSASASIRLGNKVRSRKLQIETFYTIYFNCLITLAHTLALFSLLFLFFFAILSRARARPVARLTSVGVGLRVVREWTHIADTACMQWQETTVLQVKDAFTLYHPRDLCVSISLCVYHSLALTSSQGTLCFEI